MRVFQMSYKYSIFCTSGLCGICVVIGSNTIIFSPDCLLSILVSTNKKGRLSPAPYCISAPIWRCVPNVCQTPLENMVIDGKSCTSNTRLSAYVTRSWTILVVISRVSEKAGTDFESAASPNSAISAR